VGRAIMMISESYASDSAFNYDLLSGFHVRTTTTNFNGL
jgi:hypothetical protein